MCWLRSRDLTSLGVTLSGRSVSALYFVCVALSSRSWVFSSHCHRLLGLRFMRVLSLALVTILSLRVLLVADPEYRLVMGARRGSSRLLGFVFHVPSLSAPFFTVSFVWLVLVFHTRTWPSLSPLPVGLSLSLALCLFLPLCSLHVGWCSVSCSSLVFLYVTLSRTSGSRACTARYLCSHSWFLEVDFPLLFLRVLERVLVTYCTRVLIGASH